MFGLDTILPVAGGAFGLMLGGFSGGIKGAVLGSALSNLFGKKEKSQNNFGFGDNAREGSRLSSLKVQISSYGEVIPKVYGCIRLAGNIIWTIDLKEKEVKDLEEYGDDFREVTNYAYSATLAIGLCEGEIEEIIRIWADGKILTQSESNLISKRFVWCYDARPFPFFPDLKNVWQDGDLWVTGHWINGKLGNSNLAAIVADILNTVGLKPSDYDVSRLTDIVDGYIISQHVTAREAIEQLQSAYFFDCVESDGILKFLHRLDSSQAIEISESDLVPSNNNNIKETLEITLAQELELPQKVSISHIDRCQNYETLTVEAQRQIVRTRDQINFSLPIVLDNSTAKQIADITLYNSWQERINYKLTLPPKYAYLEPTDIINVKCNDATYSMHIVKTDMQRTGQMKLVATNYNLQIYDFPSRVNYLPSQMEVPRPLANTIIEIIDLPIYQLSSIVGRGYCATIFL